MRLRLLAVGVLVAVLLGTFVVATSGSDDESGQGAATAAVRDDDLTRRMQITKPFVREMTGGLFNARGLLEPGQGEQRYRLRVAEDRVFDIGVADAEGDVRLLEPGQAVEVTGRQSGERIDALSVIISGDTR